MITPYESTETIKSMRNRTTRLDREGDYWTDDEKAQLTDMFRAGEGISAIAVLLQRTEPAVMQQIEALDLYCRKTKPIRRAKAASHPKCLCEACTLDKALCPRCEAYCSEREVA